MSTKGESYLGGLTVSSRPPGGDLLANSALPQGGEGNRSACRLGATRPRTSRGRLLAEPPSWPSAIGLSTWLMVLTVRERSADLTQLGHRETNTIASR